MLANVTEHGNSKHCFRASARKHFLFCSVHPRWISVIRQQFPLVRSLSTSFEISKTVFDTFARVKKRTSLHGRSETDWGWDYRKIFRWRLQYGEVAKMKSRILGSIRWNFPDRFADLQIHLWSLSMAMAVERNRDLKGENNFFQFASFLLLF